MRTLAALFLVGALVHPAHSQNTCACPQADEMSYETVTRTVSPSSLALCTSAGCGTLALQLAHRIITPASVTAMPPAAGAQHYLAIEANNNSGFPELPGPITLQTEGGAMFTVNLTLAQPDFLLCPANKSLVSPPPAPSGLPFFLCSKPSTRPVFRATFNEQDQFGNNNPCVIDRVDFVCQTADLTTPTTTSWLVCFSLNKRASNLVDPNVPAFVDAEIFGEFDFTGADIHTPDELCFPAIQQ